MVCILVYKYVCAHTLLGLAGFLTSMRYINTSTLAHAQTQNNQQEQKKICKQNEASNFMEKYESKFTLTIIPTRKSKPAAK